MIERDLQSLGISPNHGMGIGLRHTQVLEISFISQGCKEMGDAGSAKQGLDGFGIETEMERTCLVK
jgi:hypothetical protein